MSQATFAKGTQLQVGNGATPEAFTLIPEIKSITGPSMTADNLDVTSHDTPGGFRDHLQGLKDWGTLAFDMNWVPGHAMHQQLFDDYVAGTVRNYRLVYPNIGNTTLTFAGWVGNNPTTAPFDNVLTKHVEIIIMGSPQPVLA